MNVVKCIASKFKKIFKTIWESEIISSLEWTFSRHIDAIIENKAVLLLISLYMILTAFLVYIGHLAWRALYITEEALEQGGNKLEQLGPFGDFFGGVTNPVIGAIGFIALTITILMQRKQNSEVAKQSFESSFYNLLNLQNNIIENLDFNQSKARLSFTKFLTENVDVLYPKTIYSKNVKVKKSSAYNFYKNFNSYNNDRFGHYFRNLYRILKTIDNSKYGNETKINLARVLRAQISMDELTVLFLNCLPGVCDKGEFASLLIKYQMLEHLNIKRHGTDAIAKESFRHAEFILGGKIRVSSQEVSCYLDLNTKRYLFQTSSGAFGRNTSKDLNILKLSLQANNKPRK